MDLRQEHEEGLAAFVSPQRRARFRASLADVRLRQKLLDDLNHFEDRLDSRHAELHRPYTRHERHVEQVCDLLEGAGALNTCFLLADIDADSAKVPFARWRQSADVARRRILVLCARTARPLLQRRRLECTHSAATEGASRPRAGARTRIAALAISQPGG